MSRGIQYVGIGAALSCTLATAPMAFVLVTHDDQIAAVGERRIRIKDSRITQDAAKMAAAELR